MGCIVVRCVQKEVSRCRKSTRAITGRRFELGGAETRLRRAVRAVPAQEVSGRGYSYAVLMTRSALIGKYNSLLVFNASSNNNNNNNNNASSVNNAIKHE